MPAETPQAEANLKKKQILVVVLLIGLLVAICTQPSNDEDGDATAQVEVSLTSHSAAAVPAGAETATKPFADVRELSKMPIDEIVVFELFAPEPPKPIDRAPQHSPRVQAIYGTSSGHAALMNESIIRPGQPLPNGAKVLHVTTEGIEIGR